jgi:hypothetical protein
MNPKIVSFRQTVRLVLLFGLLFITLIDNLPRAIHAQTVPVKDPSSQTPGEAALPLTFERRTSDLDTMAKEGTIRALVLLPHGFLLCEWPSGGHLLRGAHGISAVCK